MIEGTTKPANAPAPREPSSTHARFLDREDDRSVVLGELRTDEEARLAAEIEKLRGADTARG